MTTPRKRIVLSLTQRELADPAVIIEKMREKLAVLELTLQVRTKKDDCPVEEPDEDMHALALEQLEASALKVAKAELDRRAKEIEAQQATSAAPQPPDPQKAEQGVKDLLKAIVAAGWRFVVKVTVAVLKAGA